MANKAVLCFEKPWLIEHLPQQWRDSLSWPTYAWTSDSYEQVGSGFEYTLVLRHTTQCDLRMLILRDNGIERRWDKQASKHPKVDLCKPKCRNECIAISLMHSFLHYQCWRIGDEYYRHIRIQFSPRTGVMATWSQWSQSTFINTVRR